MNDYRHGKGVYQYKNDRKKGGGLSADDIAVYKGEFIEDDFDGHAEVWYGNGDKFTGSYKNGCQVMNVPNSYHPRYDRYPFLSTN